MNHFEQQLVAGMLVNEQFGSDHSDSLRFLTRIVGAFLFVAVTGLAGIVLIGRDDAASNAVSAQQVSATVEDETVVDAR